MKSWKVVVVAVAVVAMGSPAGLRAQPVPRGTDLAQHVDPRIGLKAGMFDAGEASLGLEHIDFLKKPQAFTAPPLKPGDGPMQKLLAQLVFANSDFAFEGNTLFQ
ncbi:MAG TPA: hypothetical protein VJS11_03890, partial [Acidobacteriaceae bacterium]|nr:hypothetical protein [Acidobacteriaceae bacterium]